MGQVVMVWLVGLLLCTTTTTSSIAIPSQAVNPSCQYYVSAQRGQDSNAGSLAAPFRSLQHALQLIVHGDVSDVVVCVEAGSYNISSANLTTQRSFPPLFFLFCCFNINFFPQVQRILFFDFDRTQQNQK